MIDRVMYEFRWWRWLMGGPSAYTMLMRGYDKQTKRILYDRHMEGA